jgi:hypothetical protein
METKKVCSNDYDQACKWIMNKLSKKYTISEMAR